MTKVMLFVNLKNEHLERALDTKQGLDFMYTFLIRDMNITSKKVRPSEFRHPLSMRRFLNSCRWEVT